MGTIKKLVFVLLFMLCFVLGSGCFAEEPVHYIDYTVERTVPLGISFRMDEVRYEPVDMERVMFFTFDNGEQGMQFTQLGSVLLQVFRKDETGRTVAWKEVVNVVPPDGEYYENMVSDEIVRDVVERTNQERKKLGLVPLSVCPDLQIAAAVRANELVKKMSHFRPDGRSATSVMQYCGRISGENIAGGQSSVEQVFNGWMNSKEHKENILNPKYHETGIGYYVDESSPHKYHWVQLFRG